MKANHNCKRCKYSLVCTVSNGSKILKWKQITTRCLNQTWYYHCFQWFKDTKMKANHNHGPLVIIADITVSNGSKILKWKQITTPILIAHCLAYCFQWFKDTKMKANHNSFNSNCFGLLTVSNGSKILKWKQITTGRNLVYSVLSLFPMVQRY